MKALIQSSFLIFLALISAGTAGQKLVPDYHAKANGNPYHAISADQQGNILVYQSFDGLNGAYVGNLAKVDVNGQLSGGFSEVFTDGNILQVEVQRDDKMVIRGDFTAVNGNPTPNLVRLNADGTVDTGFTSAISKVDQFKLQSSGKIIIVALGKFSRLNTDGTLDNTFSMPSYFTPFGSIEIGNDDNIYMSSFAQLYKLKPDGGYDPDFFVGTGVNNSYISSIEVQSDGKILIAGMFTSYNGVASNSLVRLLPDGQVDATFNIGVGPTGQVFKVVERTNKNILIGGQFYEYNNQPASLVELKPDGTLHRIIAVVNYAITSIAETPDGKIAIGGEFTRVNGLERSYISKFNNDYTISHSFSPVLFYNNPNGRCLEVRENGSVLIGGTFEFEGLYDGSTIIRKKIIQLDPLGLYDDAFSPDFPTNPYVYSLLLQHDNKIVLGGPPDANGAGLVRVNPDGTRDDSFEIGAGPTNVSFALGVPYRMKLKNDTIYVAGHFDKFNGVATQSMVALMLNGAIAKTFSGVPPGTNLYDFDFQRDGKIVALGTFQVDGAPRRICRFNPDGTLDNSFAINDVQGNLNFIEIDSLDRIYIGGDLYSINGALVNSLVRFLPGGLLDTSFETGTGFQGRDDIRDLEILPDGTLAIGGYFSGYNDEEANGFAFLNNDGTRVSTPLVKFGKKSAALNMKYSNGALYLDGRFVKDDYSDVYAVVKIMLDPSARPDEPDNLRAELFEPGTFKLDWHDNSSNELAFIIERSAEDQSHFMAHDTVAANVTTSFDNKILSDKEYFYRVKAINSGGASDYSNVVSAAWNPQPSAPNNLRVNTHEPGVFQLEWDDQSSNEVAFILERSAGDQTHFVTYDSLPANTESTLDAAIAPREKYFYRIRAVNNGGKSGYSNVVSATWIPGPKAPDNLQVTYHDRGVFQLEWEDNSTDEVAFILERSTGDTLHFTVFAAVLTTMVFDSTIRAREQYFYRVKAVNDEGGSDYSNVAWNTWAPGPEAHLKLTITSRSEREFLLTWSGTAADHIGFIIERSEGSASEFVPKDTLTAETHSYVDATDESTIYFYRVGAYNEAGVVYSNIASAVRDSGGARLPVFPVPAENTLFVQIPSNASGGAWRLLSSTGQIIPLQGELENDIIRFDIQSIPPGMYLAQFVLDDQTLQSIRVVIGR